MKMRWMATAVVFGLVSLVSDRCFANRPVELGLKLGLNNATVFGDTLQYWNTNTAFIGGVFATLHMGQRLSLQPEALFVMKGADQVTFIEGLGFNQTAEIRLNYIEVPVLVSYRVPWSEKISPVVFAGPSVAFLLSAKYKYTLGDQTVDLKIGNGAATTFDLIAGGAAEFGVGETRFVLDIRYILGLGHFLKSADSDFSGSDINLIQENGEPWDMKFGMYSFMIGVAF